MNRRRIHFIARRISPFCRPRTCRVRFTQKQKLLSLITRAWNERGARSCVAIGCHVWQPVTWWTPERLIPSVRILDDLWRQRKRLAAFRADTFHANSADTLCLVFRVTSSTSFCFSFNLYLPRRRLKGHNSSRAVHREQPTDDFIAIFGSGLHSTFTSI